MKSKRTVPSVPLVRFGHFGASRGGKHTAKRPRTEYKLSPAETAGITIARGTQGGSVKTDGLGKAPADTRPERTALPDGLQMAAQAVLAGNPRMTITKQDRRRGIIQRRMILYSV